MTALSFLSPVWSSSTPPPPLPPPLAFNVAPPSIAATATVPGESSTPPSPLLPHLAFNAGGTSPHRRPLPRPPSPASRRRRPLHCSPPPSIQCERDVPPTSIDAAAAVPFAGRATVTTAAIALQLPPSCCCKAAAAAATTVPSRHCSASAASAAAKLPPLPPPPQPPPHAAATCHCHLWRPLPPHCRRRRLAVTAKRTRQANYCYKRSLELWVLL